MADKNSMDDRRRAQEEEYFRKQERELLEKMRSRAAAAEARAGIAETTGVADEAILNSLHELGFTRETITLLHLVPLVQIAWIDGGVSQRERDLVFEVAASRGVADGSEAFRQLADWLEKRPSEDFFEDSLKILRVLVKVDAEGPSPTDLVEYCTRVAEASGGILGFGNKISDAERDAIARIAAELQKDHNAAADEVVKKL